MATETVINRPAPFVEDIGKKLAEQTFYLRTVLNTSVLTRPRLCSKIAVFKME